MLKLNILAAGYPVPPYLIVRVYNCPLAPDPGYALDPWILFKHERNYYSQMCVNSFYTSGEPIFRCCLFSFLLKTLDLWIRIHGILNL